MHLCLSNFCCVHVFDDKHLIAFCDEAFKFVTQQCTSPQENPNNTANAAEGTLQTRTLPLPDTVTPAAAAIPSPTAYVVVSV